MNRRAAAVMRSALAAEGLGDGEVGVIFVDEPRIAELNACPPRQGRAHRRALVPDRRPRQPAGGTAAPAGRRGRLPGVAAAEGTPIETLLVHGALHLVGYDHEADAGEMLGTPGAAAAGGGAG